LNTTAPGNRRMSLLNAVERIGNLLPHPVTLFAIMCAILLACSALAAALGLSVVDPRDTATGNSVIHAVSLLNGDGIVRILTSLVPNFTNFAPLGTVLVSLLGVGVAEKSGLLEAAVKRIVYGAPRRLITYAVVFAAVMSNVAGELGYVVLIPLSAAIFKSLGRPPLAGIAAAFAGVSGGYSANLLLGTVDPLLAGITQASAQLVAPGYIVGPAANWYFMAASAIVITILGALVTERIIEPRLKASGNDIEATSNNLPSGVDAPSRREAVALKAAGMVVLLGVAMLAAAALLPGSSLRDASGAFGPKAPIFGSVVAFIFLFFLIPGIVYGAFVGTIRSDRDVIDAMSSAMSSMGTYVVLVFFAAQFIAFFSWSQLGPIVAISGANLLRAVDMPAPLLFACFIVICAFANLAVGSASAQWALTAPIFVPMLMLLGFSPEITQAAYRIGDSVTNLITPMMSYFGLVVAVAARYRKDIGVGTLMSTMLPYSITFLIVWTAMFCIWVFALELPVGPGSPIYFRAN
jgi:aminobenzoyl-glutamate transport protein